MIMYELYNLGTLHIVLSAFSGSNDYSSNTDPGQAICGSVNSSFRNISKWPLLRSSIYMHVYHVEETSCSGSSSTKIAIKTVESGMK